MGIIVGVAFVWFTTHFGGGFASGAQVFQYFMKHGFWALLAPAFALAYNAFYYSYALHFAKKHKLYDYRSYNKYFYGKYAFIFSNLFEFLYIVVMLLPPSVAFATGGATLEALTGLPYLVCTLIIGIFIFFVAVYGTDVVRRVASALSVLIIAGLIVTYIPNIIAQWPTIAENLSTAAKASTGFNAFKAALYSAFIYGTFQLANIAALVQHAESFDRPKDGIASSIIGWVINYLMMLMTVLGLFAVVHLPDIESVSIPILTMVDQGVGIMILKPIISTLIILGSVSTGVNMVASMTKRIQGALEKPEALKRSKETGKPTKLAIITTLICCIINFSIAQFGLIPLIGKGYSFIAYLAIPIITIPYIIHMIATNFDRKNPPRVTESELE